MDSASPALPLPPSPGISAYVPPGPQAFQPPPQAQATQTAPAPGQRPVGRPNADPDVQEQRAERSLLKQRLKNILPAAMTDGKVAIFRLQGRRGRTKEGNKPVMTMLFGQLEKAMTEGGYADTGVLIEDTLRAKYGDKGRFLWEAQDSHGRILGEAGAVEVDLNSSTDNYTEENMEDEENENALPQTEAPPAFFQQQQAAPAPPPFDAAVHAQTVRGIITEEKKSAENMVTVMMTMMQQQNQQQVMAMQQQQQQAELRRVEEDRRRDRDEQKEREERKMELERMRLEQERRDKDEQRREDRERDRRTAEQAMQMQFFQAIFNKPERPDVVTPMLMKMVDSKGDRDGMKEVFGMMSEASKQAMVTQGEATKHMLSAQADASKTLMGNVMSISQTMVEQMAQSQAEPTDDPMEKVARVFKMIAPVLGGLNQNTQQAVAAVQPQPQRIAQQPAPIPPTEYIKGGLYTIMRLENGQIAARQRFQALKWCAENLPRPMLDAIRSGVQDNVLAIGAEGMDNTLMAWIQDPQHLAFLQDCVVDIQRMLLGAMTQDTARASFEKHVAYMQAKGQPVQQEAAPAQPVAESAIPAEVKDADLAQPVAEKPANGKRSAPPPSDKPIAEAEQN